MAATIVGIDIGSTAVRAVEVQGASTSTPVISRYLEEPLPEGSARRGEVIDAASVASALRRLWSAGEFKAKDVVLGVGGQGVFARDLTVPSAPLAHIRESLPFQVQDLLPVPVSEAFLDFYPISQGDGPDGPVVNGLLVAATRHTVRMNVEAATLAGLRPVHVDLIPFALSRAVAPVRTASGLSVLVAVGANTTNVVVIDGGVPQFVRIISAGGDDITRELSHRLPLSLTEAEELKRRLGMESAAQVPEHREALEVIYSVAGELLNGIRNTLNYYASTKKNVAFDRVIVSGGGASLIGFTAALSELVDLPVERAEMLGGAPLPWPGKESNPEVHDAMSTAFGLALGTRA